MDAAASTPFDVKALFDEAVKLHQSRRLVEAEERYRRILAAQPRHAGALHLLGVVDIQRGQHQAAVERIGAALAINPRAAPFHGNFATALQALRRFDEAEKHYREAVRLDPNYADAHNNLGALLEKRARHLDAAQCYRAALAARPTFAEAHNNLGQLLRGLGQVDESIKHLEEAIRLRPSYGDAHRGLGMALARQDKSDAAIVALRKAIELNPADAEAHNHLGSRLKLKGLLDEAEAAYRRALELRPNYVDVHNNLGNVHFRRGRLDEAEACYRRALALRPNYPDGHGNLGITAMGRCRYDEAVGYFRRALELRPVYPEAQCNLSQALLVLGQFREGWDKYEARWKLPALPPRPFRQPWWRGESIVGQTILLHVEQGLGDAIQFARYAPIVQRLGATVILEVPRELIRLFAPIAAQGIRLVKRGAPLPHFDVHCPLLSIPGALGCDLTSIPADVPYLGVDPGTLAAWRARLPAEGTLKVGLVWAGNPQHGNDHNRSFRPLAFKPLFAVPGVRYFSLQKQRRTGDDADLAALGPITDLGPELKDFADTAAALSALDLLVAADTSIVHLAGALARPVWTMVPYSPDWRWLLAREDTPWYPTMRLLRQPRERDWGSVMARVARDIAALARGHQTLPAPGV
ncbi:MAG: tetratricopeptide repeat protein [Alphaproteobacteria bacterium]|nr:tetratricopeptide repeat protein [Alphaproteobacteria bacterium]